MNSVVFIDTNSHKEVIQTVFPFGHVPHSDLHCFPELSIIAHVHHPSAKKEVGSGVFKRWN